MTNNDIDNNCPTQLIRYTPPSKLHAYVKYDVTVQVKPRVGGHWSVPQLIVVQTEADGENIYCIVRLDKHIRHLTWYAFNSFL